MAENPIITCPECKKKFKGKTDLAGKKIKCPFCAKPFLVLADQPAGAPAAAGQGQAAAAPQTRKIFEDEEGDTSPYGVTALDITPRCPNCASPMADEKAFICLFCGYNSLTREIGKTEKIIAHTTGDIIMHQLPAYICVAVSLLFIFGIMFYSLVLPNLMSKGGAAFWGHESLKMWFTLITMGIVWGCGMFTYKRLIVAPLPPEKKLD